MKEKQDLKDIVKPRGGKQQQNQEQCSQKEKEQVPSSKVG